jgi:hypothetical protein
MEMENRLCGCGTVALEQIEAVRIYRFIDCRSYLFRGRNGSGQGRVGNGVNIGGVFLRNHQRMPFVGRIDIHEGQGIVVFEQFKARNLTGDDFSKQAVSVCSHGFSPIISRVVPRGLSGRPSSISRKRATDKRHSVVVIFVGSRVHLALNSNSRRQVQIIDLRVYLRSLHLLIKNHAINTIAFPPSLAGVLVSERRVFFLLFVKC